MGINTGLRISDILKLRIGDLKGSHISMREKDRKTETYSTKSSVKERTTLVH